MISRTTNNKDLAWKWYGGRGISVCEEWKSFINYKKYIDDFLGPKPSKFHSIDRINNEGNYEPGNIRWATKKVQMINRRAPIWRRTEKTCVECGKIFTLSVNRNKGVKAAKFCSGACRNRNFYWRKKALFLGKDCLDIRHSISDCSIELN